jgi:membrane protein
VDPNRLLRRADDLQRGRSWTAVPVAVAKKFGEDRAGRLAAVIAYQGFLSVFPLLLVFVSVVGFVLHGNADLQRRLVDSALATLPIVGTQIGQTVHGTAGSPVAVAVGLALALWAGLGVLSAVQDALNDVWNVSRDARPGLVRRVLRGSVMLISFGVALAVSAGLAAVGSSGGWLSPGMKALSLVGSLALNVALFLTIYAVLTSTTVRARAHLPGALVAGAGWTALLSVGSWFVDRQIQGASEVYGVFAVVLGLLVWIHLGAQVLLVGAELNVVRLRRLWPRSLVEPSDRAARRPSRGPTQPEVVDVRVPDADQAASRTPS